MKKCIALSNSDVFIMLINVKMPTIVLLMLKCQQLYCWHFNIYEQDKFRAQLSMNIVL